MEASATSASFPVGAVIVSARRTIARAPSEVYALLADLRRHWPLLGADLVRAGIVDGSGDESAELVVRGPLPGLQRTVVTRVTRAVPNSEFGGIAEAGRTVALIEWRLAGVDDGCEVAFSGSIVPGGTRDRLLVAAVRPWLARRCDQVLERLEQELTSQDQNH